MEVEEAEKKRQKGEKKKKNPGLFPVGLEGKKEKTEGKGGKKGGTGRASEKNHAEDE